MELRFHHIAIGVKNLSLAIRFYTDVLGYRFAKEGLYSKIYESHQPGNRLRYVLLSMPSAEDAWTELMEPMEGPTLSFMKEKGEGIIQHLTFRTKDIEETYDEFIRKGLTPVDEFGSTLTTKFRLAASGSRYFELPKEKTHGTSIQIIEPRKEI
jgi:catechol 2,3-dioxygenase-like lactoylglutathione lyase family enzyme